MLAPFLLLLCRPLDTHLCNGSVPASPTRPKLETSSTKGRSAHPSRDCYCEGGHTQDDEGIHAGNLCSPGVDILIRNDRSGETDSSNRGDNRSSEVDEAALAPEVEEAVPGQDFRRIVAGAGRGMSGELRFALSSDAAAGHRRQSCCGGISAVKLLQWRRRGGEEGLGGSRRVEGAREVGGCAEAAASGGGKGNSHVCEVAGERVVRDPDEWRVCSCSQVGM